VQIDNQQLFRITATTTIGAVSPYLNSLGSIYSKGVVYKLSEYDQTCWSVSTKLSVLANEFYVWYQIVFA
jgi:hypothetical protein